jgi:hypothetical protein
MSTERALRGVVLGRKNHYGSRSERGTEVAALFYSLIESAKLAGAEPHAYLLTATRAAIRHQPIPLPRTHSHGCVVTLAELSLELLRIQGESDLSDSQLLTLMVNRVAAWKTDGTTPSELASAQHRILGGIWLLVRSHRP